MAMNGTQLGDEIVAALTTAGLIGRGPGDPQPTPSEVWQVVGQAIVAHVQANAVVAVTVPVEASDVGLQSYTVAPAGPVATTGPLTPLTLDGQGSIS